MASPKCVIGVDLGGTNVRAQAYYEDGTPAGEHAINPSRAQEGTERIIEATATTIHAAMARSEAEATAVGLAIPGQVDDRAGVVRWCPNFGETVNGIFVNWNDVPVRDPLRRYVDLPISMGNDANLAALGEYMYGSGHGNARCLVMMTLGTGIGGGVVLGPEAVQGKSSGPLLLIGGFGGGVELGHTVIQHQGLDCPAGSYGAIEAYCQRDSIVRRAVHRIQRGRPTILKDLVEGDLAKLTPRLISVAAEQGDALAIGVWNDVGEMLGVGIGNQIAVFNPDVVAIGGQIAKAGDLVLGPAREAAANVCPPGLFAEAKIVLAERIDDCGILGAAALACQIIAHD